MMIIDQFFSLYKKMYAPIAEIRDLIFRAYSKQKPCPAVRECVFLRPVRKVVPKAALFLHIIYWYQVDRYFLSKSSGGNGREVFSTLTNAYQA